MTDEELVAQARRGNSDAFGELVGRHHAAVFRTALIVCRSREDADDVAQEALIQAWRKLDRFRGEASFKTWLLTITWRLALSRHGSVWARWRRLTASDELVDALAIRSSEPSAEDRVASAELLDLVRSLVHRLPARMREALLIAAAGDCTFEEMGVILRAPVGTLKWRVMEGRRRLERELAARGIAWQ